MNKRGMRPSRVLAKLRAGETVSCFKINLADVRAMEIAAQSGFDCLWTGSEHIGNDLSILQNQIITAKAYDVDVLCRVPRGSYSDYIRPLEMDAAGIMVPHVMSAEDAENVVRMTRFQPLGRRALDGGNADAAYCNIPLTDYIEQANCERFIVLQIEDPEPLAELEAIAELPGYDMLFFGPGDFSHAIGTPGQMDNPKIIEARQRIADVANKHGKFAATTCAPDQIAKFHDMGYHFLSTGADVVGLGQYCREMAASFGVETPNSPISYYGKTKQK